MLTNIHESFFPKLYKVIHIYESKNSYEFWLESTGTESTCPKCGSESGRIHGYQQRTARDLPILGKGVTLDITQKKYYCENEKCEVEIFTEANELILPYSQFTVRCREYMLRVAAVVSCEAAVKVLAYQGIRVSGDTLLNMVRLAGAEYKGKIGTKIGVDDWSYRKGQEYGTIICDLETHDVIEVLKGRDSETLEKWLKGYPNIEIVSRDRASEYSSAVNKALPQAVQIADRFHITKNLLDALTETMKGFMREVIEIPVGDNTKPTEVAENIRYVQNADIEFIAFNELNARFESNSAAEMLPNNSYTEQNSVIEPIVGEVPPTIKQTEINEENPALKKIPKRSTQSRTSKTRQI